MTFDDFLGIAVPIAIFLLLFILVYSKAKEPIDKFFSSFSGGEDYEEDSNISYKQISGVEEWMKK